MVGTVVVGTMVGAVVRTVVGQWDSGTVGTVVGTVRTVGQHSGTAVGTVGTLGQWWALGTVRQWWEQWREWDRGGD
eukprot:8089012-Pyramimonas_sp.AAC.1